MSQEIGQLLRTHGVPIMHCLGERAAIKMLHDDARYGKHQLGAVLFPYANTEFVLRAREVALEHQLIAVVPAHSFHFGRIARIEDGFDDAVSDRLDPQEIAAVFLARTRHREAMLQRIIYAGPLEVDLRRREARMYQKKVSFTPKEFSILAKLAEYQGKSVSKASVRHFFNASSVDPEGVMRTYMCRIRSRLKKIDPVVGKRLIRYSRDFGYMLATDESMQEV
ncbi:response regulator transcription factor [Candidatus Nomurabacteria bacterium]|nr:response regulator transcription factor [Candidatus Nomurabacteria bacterium]